MHGFELTCGRMVAGSGADFGIPKADIAKVLETDPRKFVSSLPGAGHRPNQDNTKMAENLFRKATGEGREAVTAAISWLKTRAGWKETAVHELSGRNGAPIETVTVSLRDRLEEILSGRSERLEHHPGPSGNEQS